MSIAESLLPEFDREMGLTRRLLERLPDGQFRTRGPISPMMRPMMVITTSISTKVNPSSLILRRCEGQFWLTRSLLKRLINVIVNQPLI